MSKFRVGQRVRVVGADYFGLDSHPAGLEAVITEGPGSFVGPFSGHVYTWCVATTCGRLIYANSPDLEPATDCYDKTEWSECVWRPEHLRVDA